jgi:GNAT superfamily N-acetyltransferase
VEIRAATIEDVEALVTLHLDTVLVAYRDWFPTDAAPPDRDALVDRWTEDVAGAFVAVDGALIVGSVVARAHGELARLHVHPARWGERIGAALHDVAVDALRDAGHERAGLWVIEENARARSLYERRGWVLDPTQEIVELGVREVRYVLEL